MTSVSRTDIKILCECCREMQKAFKRKDIKTAKDLCHAFDEALEPLPTDDPNVERIIFMIDQIRCTTDDFLMQKGCDLYVVDLIPKCIMDIIIDWS